MRRNNIILVLICLLLTSCHRPDQIVVFYRNGTVEPSIPYSCSRLYSMAMDTDEKYVVLDTVYVPHEDFVKLQEYIDSLTIVPSEHLIKHIVDCRIVAIHDTTAVAFAEYSYKSDMDYGLNSVDNLVYGDPYIAWLLKSYSGYYNFFDKKDLLAFYPEVKKFGIPSTYKRFGYSPKKEIEVPTTSPSLKGKLVYVGSPLLASKVIMVDGGKEKE